MNYFEEVVSKQLKKKPLKWGITGVAGFIGSHLLETLLKLDQKVVGLDNFFTGSRKNLNDVKKQVSPAQWQRFRFIKGDTRDLKTCEKFCQGLDKVLHQAALGSVPRSIEDPVLTNAMNVDGFVNILAASHKHKIKRVVYASSSAIYGDDTSEKKREDRIGKCLSPYAVSKFVNEVYAHNFGFVYGMECVGLRYFNVFGPRQDPNGAYAAVIPKWIDAFLNKQPIVIYGDGSTSRDFCYVGNVVQANLLAAMTDNKSATNQIFNIALSDQTSLLELFEILKAELAKTHPKVGQSKPKFKPFRKGDILHSCAEVGKAKKLLNYQPTHDVRDGLAVAMSWYEKNAR